MSAQRPAGRPRRDGAADERASAVRQICVIGIGAGDPDDVTVAAARALNAADVFFVIEKPGSRQDLARQRLEIIARHRDGARAYRTVAIADPPRDRAAARYVDAVEHWRERRADVWEAQIRDELDGASCGAFLVWGDPALYDSTIAVLDAIAARGALELEVRVVPGVSAIASLTARHGIALNRVGGSVQITTGRRLASHGFPLEADDVVVMLDADCAFATLPDGDEIEIYWGAYLGTPDEILVAGTLGEVAGEIARLRAEARARKGWIMDTYLLRRMRQS